MCATPTVKSALRKQVSAALKTLTAAQLATQSAAVLAHLSGLPAYTSCTSASVYLPMDNGAEVDTWPIVADLLARGARVAIPRVTGPAPTDLVMLRLNSLEQAQALPRTKWGIPEPDDALAAQMEDATAANDLTLLLVPGVAFDARCGRLGHGRGYYDAFIKRQRALGRDGDGAGVLVVGLGLSAQLVDEVPMSETDERLDLVITPEGRLGYTSAADHALATELSDANRKRRDRHDGESRGGGGGATTATEAAASPPAGDAISSKLDLDERVTLSAGRYKYACLRLTKEGEEPMIAVRSARGEYHATVAEPAVDAYEAQGYTAKPLGGGRILRDDAAKTIHIYGYSVGFGGAEGGPPGRGMRDHSQVAALVQMAFPGYEVTYDASGY